MFLPVQISGNRLTFPLCGVVCIFREYVYGIALLTRTSLRLLHSHQRSKENLR